MKRLTLMILLALTALVGGVFAQPADELTTLAQYAPPETVLFATVRTDETFFASVDVLLASALNKFPMEMLPPGGVSIYDALNDFDYSVSDSSARDFRANVRPWLGDHVAMIFPGIESLDGNPTYLYEVTDLDAAKAFLDASLVADSGRLPYYSEPVTEDNGALHYVSEYSFDPHVFLMEGLLIVGDLENVARLVMPGADAVKLSQTSQFQETLAALPEADYSAAVYLNPAPIIDRVAAEAMSELADAGFDVNFDDIAAMIGQVAAGFTVLGERSLVMDVANTGSVPLEFAPLNLNLLNSIPADTPLLVQGSGVGGLVKAGLEGLYALDAYLKEQGVLPIPDAGFLGEFGPDDLAAFLRLSFEGTYQLDLDETLDWMNGDFVAYLRLVASEASPVGILPEVGFMMATDNPEATAQLVAAQGEMAMNAFAPVTFEEGTVTIPLGQLFSVPELLTFKITSNDAFYLMGTQSTIDYALNPSGDSVTSSAPYGVESRLFLPNAVALWYADLAPIRAAVAAFMEAMPGMITENDAAMLNALLNVIDTASITAAQSESGTLAARFSLTLGE